jgi:hypothetical protein
MTDRELLELAAKAAGYATIQYQNLKDSSLDIRYGIDEAIWNGEDYWNPLENDGDALRLAVKLNLFIDTCGADVLAGWVVDKDALSMNTLTQAKNGDPYAATRRAIVRAAAEIGKSMEVTK